MGSNLSCEEIQTMLSAYFDGELAENEISQVEIHLNSCQDCNQELARIKQLSGLLKNSVQNVSNNDSLAAIVVNRLYNEKEITCNEVLEEVSAYHDCELNLKLHYLVKEHLENCPECDAEYKKVVKLSKALRISSANNPEDISLWSKITKNVTECRDVQKRLSSYIDSELSKEEIIDVNDHLMVCEDCRSDYKDLRQTQSAVKMYFENFNYIEIEFSAADFAVNRLNRYYRKRVYVASLTAVVIIMLIGWFFINSVQPVIRETYIDKTNIKKKNDPMYLNMQDFILIDNSTMAPEESLSVLYGR